MTSILEDYVKKLVRVKTTGRTGNTTNYIGRFARFDDEFIELNPGIGTKLEFAIDNGKKKKYDYREEIVRVKEQEKLKEKYPSYLKDRRTGRIPIRKDAIVSIEELVED